MSSGKLKIEFDNTAPPTPEANTSIIYPLGPSGDFFQKTPDGAVKQMTFPSQGLTEDVLVYNTTTQKWEAQVSKLPYRRIIQFLEDWNCNTASGTNNLRQSTASGGSLLSNDNSPINSLYNKSGVLRLRTTNTANSRAGVDTGGVGNFLLSNGEAFCEFNFYLGASYSVVAENNVFIAGLGDSIGGNFVNLVHGVYIKYHPAANINLLAVCSESNVHTEQTLGLISVETWYRVRISVNTTGTQATFTLLDDNGTVLFTTTINSNIPVGTNNFVGPAIMSRKNLAGVLANIDAFVDYFYCRKEITGR